MKNIIQANEDNSRDDLGVRNMSFFAVVAEMLSDLPERSREITKKRFGLVHDEPETLEKIGRDYGITRERVRQIVADTLKKVSGRINDLSFEQAKEEIIFTIKSNSGIIKETELLKYLCRDDNKEANALVFLRECSGKILTADAGGEKVWFLNRNKLDKSGEIGLVAQNILKKSKKLFSDDDMIESVTSAKPELSKKEVVDYLNIFPLIKKNKFGKWGMAEWIEISPKGTRERIYSILKEKGKPLHFTKIAGLIDEYGLGKRKAHVQTVHNELIKNDQFVLIGRGIYALKEWGYAKGTIRDVLEGILSKSSRSLSRDEILEEVARIRQVKKATVLINLSNSELFVKQNNLYSAKKLKTSK